MRDEDILSALDWEVENEEARIVVMADLWLDRPNTLDSLHSVLTGIPRRSEATVLVNPEVCPRRLGRWALKCDQANSQDYTVQASISPYKKYCYCLRRDY